MELALKRIRAPQRLLLEYMQEKPLCQILGFLRSVAAAPHISVERIPVDLVEFTERYLKTGCLALGGEQDYAPPSGMKSVSIVP